MLTDEEMAHWFGPVQQVMSSVPGVTVGLPLCKVCGAAVGMAENDHEALHRHIRWHLFGHTQMRPIA